MNIEMPRGDIRPVRFSVKNQNGKAAGIQFDEIYFTVKTNFTVADYLFQKRLSTGDIELLSDGSYQFVIRPEDTNNLKVGKYVFDIELCYLDEIKQTTVGSLVLTNEVTFSSNEG